MQGLVPGRDKLSLITLTRDDENVYIIHPDKNTYISPNLVSVLDGGLKKWNLEKSPLTTDSTNLTQTNYTASTKKGLIVECLK